MTRSGPDGRALGAVMFSRFTPVAGRVSLPDICCDLVWARERLVIVGPATQGRVSTYVGEEVQLLNLDPIAARAWLGIPLEELTDRRTPLEDVDAALAHRLSAMFAEGRARALVGPGSFGQSRAGRVAGAADALRRGLGVRAAAAQADISERQLERLFMDQFGLSPRDYRRVLRFRRAIASIRAGESLAGGALAAGYADQSHFTRETRAMTGRSPRALLPNVANVQEVLASTRQD